MNAAYVEQRARFIGRLKEFRKTQRISAEEFARLMRERGYDWQRETVANLESGRRKDVKLGEALQIADIMGVSLAQLISSEPLKLVLETTIL